MPTFYEIDSTRVTFREYTWGTKNPVALLLGGLLKVFKVRIPSSSDDPNVDSTLPFVVDQLPHDVAMMFVPLTEQLQALGFCDPVYHFIEDHGTQSRVYWATFRHYSGQHCARIHHRYWGKAQKPNRGLFPMFITWFMDGTFLVSSSGKPDVAEPETVLMNRMPKASAENLWTEHQRWAEGQLSRTSIFSVVSRELVIEETERLHLLQRDFHLERGFFRLKNAKEQAATEAFSANFEEARSTGMEYPEIMAEIMRIQDKKPRWSSGIWILVASAIGYFAVGTARWDWKFALALIPILLIHETGHWAAMQIFGYKNLRMFFIPFFGAAVTGQNWNVRGWKKALVSLAGPLPGIGLGAVIGIAGTIANVAWLKEAGFLFITINGINLLPVMPLDGGRFLHTTLFCRNRWLDIVFRGVAVLGLIALSAAGIGRVTIGLATVLTIGLPIAFKMGKIVDRFRQQSFPPPLPGEDQIPPGIAQMIISAVKAELPNKANNKMVAEQTINIYETLNAKPPGALATVGLLGLYGGGLFISLVCAMILLISKEGGLGDFFRAAVRQPQHTIECGSTQSWSGSAAKNDGAPQNFIVSTFKKPAEAQRSFSTLTPRLPDTASAMLFGDSVIVALPEPDKAAREKWFDDLSAQCTNTFVVASNTSLSVSLTFIASEATSASNLVENLSDYLRSPVSSQLIAPWDPEALSSNYKQWQKARHVWLEVNQKINGVSTNAAFKEFGKQISKATLRGNQEEVKRIQKEMENKRTALEKEIRAGMHKQYASTPYDEIVTLNEELSSISFTNRTERRAVLQKLAPKLGKKANVPNNTTFMSFSSVSRHGLMIECPYLTVANPTVEFPTVVKWLCNQGCVGTRYEIQQFSFNFDDDGSSDEN